MLLGPTLSPSGFLNGLAESEILLDVYRGRPRCSARVSPAMSFIWVVVLALVLLLGAAAFQRSRRQLLAGIRTSWGQPIERVRRIDAISKSHASRVAVATSSRSLDSRTWVDLNLDEVFAAIDRTQSTLGQHALYHRLRTAPVADHLEAFEALVSRMSLDVPARERAQMALARLQDPHGYDVWWLAESDAVEPRGWYGAFPLLTVAAVVLIATAPFWPASQTLLMVILALNVAVRYGTDGHIFAIARSFRQLAPLIATAESLGFLTGDDIEPIVGSLHTEVSKLARLKLISRWVSGDPFMLSIGSSWSVTVITDFVNVIYEYLNLALLLDATGVYLGVRDLRAKRGSLLRAVAAAGDIDVAISVASYRAGREDWTRPRFRPLHATAELAELRHPLVDDAVPNSIALRPGRGVLVTGSNMSGKSTFLRTVGVNAILAQTIDTCLAQHYAAPVFNVRSCIGRADDLLTGESYYIVEVDALLGLVRASENAAPHLFLLDELFRGTNAVERIAAGQAVLQELVSGGVMTKPHVVLAATHDGELVELLPESFDAYHFGDSIGPDGLVFDHRLQRGPARTRNAIALLRLHGASEVLLKRALSTAGMLDRQRGTTLMAR
jgi:hypothetical protein